MSAPSEISTFAEKLRVVLQATGLGRARLAQIARVDKSVASRWLSGQTRPSEASIERLTESVRRIRTEFTRADWDLPIAELAARFGLTTTSAAPQVPGGLLNPWAQPGADLAVLERAYVGAWLFFYASMQAQTRITCCLVEFHREGDALAITVGHTGIWRGTGPVFARNAKLFLSADDRLRGSAIALWAMWGVNSGVAVVLDGLNMTQATDISGSLAVSRCLAMRIAGPPRDTADRAGRFERMVRRIEEMGTLALAEQLPAPLQAVFREPPPIEGLPCVQRVTAERNLACSAADLQWLEAEDGPRRRALTALEAAFTPVLEQAG